MITFPCNGSTAIHNHDFVFANYIMFLSIRNADTIAGKIRLGLNFCIHSQTATGLHCTNSSITLDTLRKVNPR